MNKLVVITGCSGGGKSTLVAKLEAQGYTTIPEVGRELVKEQLAINGVTPWDNPQDFCELLIDRSIAAYKKANNMPTAKDNIIFFDRCFLEGIAYYQTLKIDKYDYAIHELRYYPVIFIVPPWQEIYREDEERKHSFNDAVAAYNRDLTFYVQSGYQLIEIPKVNVKERVQFIIQQIKDREKRIENNIINGHTNRYL